MDGTTDRTTIAQTDNLSIATSAAGTHALVSVTPAALLSPGYRLEDRVRGRSLHVQRRPDERMNHKTAILLVTTLALNEASRGEARGLLQEIASSTGVVVTQVLGPGGSSSTGRISATSRSQGTPSAARRVCFAGRLRGRSSQREAIPELELAPGQVGRLLHRPTYRDPSVLRRGRVGTSGVTST